MGEKLVAAAVKKLFRYYDSPFFKNSVHSRLIFFTLGRFPCQKFTWHRQSRCCNFMIGRSRPNFAFPVCRGKNRVVPDYSGQNSFFFSDFADRGDASTIGAVEKTNKATSNIIRKLPATGTTFATVGFFRCKKF